MIDRNGAAFGFVLDYLRGQANVIPHSSQDYVQLQADAEYYQVKISKHWQLSSQASTVVEAGQSLLSCISINNQLNVHLSYFSMCARLLCSLAN